DEHGQEIDATQHLQGGARARFQIDEVTIAAYKITNDPDHKRDQRNLQRQEQPIRHDPRIPLLERRQEIDFMNANQDLAQDPQNKQNSKRPQQQRVTNGNEPDDGQW